MKWLIPFALLVASSIAAPAAPGVLTKRAIDAATLAQLNLYEQFAAATYCPDNNNSTGTKLTCSAGNCPLVEAADTNTIAEFEDTVNTDATGYVATDNTNKLIVVAYRGSHSVRNFVTDFNFPMTQTDICANCTAHQGFWGGWLETRDSINAAVKSASTANPSYQVLVTGHSLGGALSTIAAAELRNQGYNTILCTFGSPRVASSALTTYITNQPGGNYRVTHTNDPVPRVPFDWLDFSHYSPEYFISSGNDVPVTTNDVTRLDGPNNPAGNAGAPGADVNAHLWYLNGISDCTPESIELKRDLAAVEA